MLLISKKHIRTIGRRNGQGKGENNILVFGTVQHSTAARAKAGLSHSQSVQDARRYIGIAATARIPVDWAQRVHTSRIYDSFVFGFEFGRK